MYTAVYIYIYIYIFVYVCVCIYTYIHFHESIPEALVILIAKPAVLDAQLVEHMLKALEEGTQH